VQYYQKISMNGSSEKKRGKVAARGKSNPVMAVEQDADAEPEKINFVRVIAQYEMGDVVEIVVDGDTEFCFMAKKGSHETNPRLSIGLKVLVKLKCGGLRLLSPLLDVNDDFHVIISDHEEEIANKERLKGVVIGGGDHGSGDGSGDIIDGKSECWTCSVCTFINAKRETQCKICQTVQPRDKLTLRSAAGSKRRKKGL
jgi:hypothetical protein